MRLMPLAPLLLLLTACGPKTDSADEKPARELTSRFEASTDAEGNLQIRTRNRRFDVVSLYLGERYEHLLLEQSVETERSTGADGAQGRVVVEAWPATGPRGSAPRYRIEAPGESGEALDPLYRIRREGCCGARNLDRYFSLRTGQALFSASDRPLRVEVPNTPLERYLGVHDNYAIEPVPESVADRRVVAALAYGDGNAPAARTLIVAPAGGDYAVDEFRLLLDGKPVETDTLTLWALDGQKNPAQLGGFVVEVTLGNAEEMARLRIPVAGDRLQPAQAKLERGFTLRAADSR